MTQIVAELLDRLESVSGRAGEDDLRRIIGDWRGTLDPRAIRWAVFQWLSESAAIDQLRRAARETSTHYVWPLHACGNGFSLVINEFKDPLHMTVGYATTLHNHRYSFASLVLSGGYGQVLSDVDMAGPGGNSRIRVLASDDISRGDIVTVHHSEFHRLTYISHGTVTLVAKCPPAKESSTSVNLTTMTMSRHVPVEARFEKLMKSLLRTAEETTEDESRARLG